jgi:AcrR family transcriptional regulator
MSEENMGNGSFQNEEWLNEWLQTIAEDEPLTDKQRRILKAAIEIFAEKGFAATSTSEIAQKAGVAEGTIFRHYKTKKDLLISIVTPVMIHFVAPFVVREFVKVLNTQYDSLDQFLRAVIHNRIQFVKEHTDTVKILVQEIPFHPELREQFKKHVLPKVTGEMQKIIRHFKEKGEIREIPDMTAIRLMASSVIGFLFVRYLMAPELDWDDELEIEETIRFIQNGLS